MVLVNVIAFAVLKILHNLVSMQKSLFANNCWSKIRKSVQHDLTFILIKLSEKRSSFVKIRLALEIKKVASFIKTRFYLNEGCTKIISIDILKLLWFQCMDITFIYLIDFPLPFALVFHFFFFHFFFFPWASDFFPIWISQKMSKWKCQIILFDVSIVSLDIAKVDHVSKI